MWDYPSQIRLAKTEFPACAKEPTFRRLRHARPAPCVCQRQRQCQPCPHLGIVFHERDVCCQAAPTRQCLDSSQQEGCHGLTGNSLHRSLGERLLSQRVDFFEAHRCCIRHRSAQHHATHEAQIQLCADETCLLRRVIQPEGHAKPQSVPACCSISSRIVCRSCIRKCTTNCRSSIHTRWRAAIRR